jgi:hypothetical protein
MLVTKYQISAIKSYWEKCDEKYLGRTDRRTEVKQYTPSPFGEHIVGSVFGLIRFLLPVCRLSWFLYTLNIYAHFSSHFSQLLLMACSMCIKINKIGKQEVGIWWVQKRYPQYGISIWSLWPNIRFLPSIVVLLYSRSPKGEGVYCFTSVRLSVRPRYFSSHFSQ